MIEKLVFMVEEPSMEAALLAILPRLIPKGILFQIIPHNGKSALERSIPKKLRGWREPGVYFVVLRDNDGADCSIIKSALCDICVRAGRPDTLVRIACQELEAWFLGDLTAVGQAYNRTSLVALQVKEKYRFPDEIGKPSLDLKALIPHYQKVNGARTIAPLMDLERNQSTSFRNFVSGVRKVVSMAQSPLDRQA